MSRVMHGGGRVDTEYLFTLYATGDGAKIRGATMGLVRFVSYCCSSTEIKLLIVSSQTF